MDLEHRAQTLLNTLCDSFPLGYRPRLIWKNFRVTAGMAYYRDKAIGLSRSVLTTEEQLDDTVIHEYAHLLAVARHGRKAAGHGVAWQTAMRDLGREPKVTHNYPVQRNQRRQQVGYTCQRCGTVLLRPRRLPARRRYSHVGCGGVIKFSWVREVMVTESSA